MRVASKVKHEGKEVKFVVSGQRIVYAGLEEKTAHIIIRVERFAKHISLRTEFAHVFGSREAAKHLAAMLNKAQK